MQCVVKGGKIDKGILNHALFCNSYSCFLTYKFQCSRFLPTYRHGKIESEGKVKQSDMYGKQYCKKKKTLSLGFI